MADDAPTCQVCGEPMQPGEEMFMYHGSLGPCPKPPLKRIKAPGLGRDPNSSLTLNLHVSHLLSDDDFRSLHEHILKWRGSPVPDNG